MIAERLTDGGQARQYICIVSQATYPGTVPDERSKDPHPYLSGPTPLTNTTYLKANFMKSTDNKRDLKIIDDSFHLVGKER